MAICINCGAQMDDNAPFCPVCGQAGVQQQASFQQQAFQQPNFQQQAFQQPNFQQQQAFQQPNFQQQQAFQQQAFQQQQNFQQPGVFQQPVYRDQMPGYYQQTGADRKAEIYEMIAAALIPLLGVILYFVHKKDKPTAASLIIRIALISYGIRFLIGFFFGLLS